ncbi:MAG: ATP-binding protein [Coriobacteriia bacterium]|nr:ATP-binding protein [Coriobacteriia bacterium]
MAQEERSDTAASGVTQTNMQTVCDEAHRRKIPRFTLAFIGTAAFWTLVIGVLLTLNISQAYDNAHQSAFIQAQASFEGDVAYRHWASELGGVYAPVSEGGLQPNPYLPNDGTRDIPGPNDTTLTKVNPAYMTRLVYEQQENNSGVVGHITSNDPIRHANVPDMWESKALTLIEESEELENVSSVIDMDDQKYMRFMGALWVGEGCLKCHAAQGYQVGDLRGGISITLPMEPYLAATGEYVKTLAMTHIFIWLLGLAIIVLLTHRLFLNLRKREATKTELVNLNNELEARVEERTSDLEAARLSAVASSQAKSVFLSNMSHEIRTPMNAIIGMTTLGLRADDVEHKNKSFEHIGVASDHLLGVINDILDMSKIEANCLELSRLPFSLAQALEKIALINDHKLKEKYIEFSLEIDPGLPEAISGDEQRFAQIVTNFLGNAIKFTPQFGQISLRALLAEDGKEDCLLRIEVEDNGIGITPEQSERIFQSFVQATPDTTRKYGGTGLGLAISMRLAKMMGGEVGVESEYGSGSIFYLSFRAPKIDAGKLEDENQEEHAEEIKMPDFKGRRLLLVDDVEVNREIVTALLEPTEISIVNAANGADAVQIYTQDPLSFDLIFMDIQMPVLDGVKATQQIRTLEIAQSLRPVPIVAMTANVFAEDIAGYLNEGMSSFVGKPVDLVEMIKAMCEQLKSAPKLRTCQSSAAA